MNGEDVGARGGSALSVEVVTGPAATTVAVDGELDLAGEGALAKALDGVRDAERVVIDLNGLTFVDSTGLRLLLQAERHLGEAGVPVAFRLPEEGPVLRLLRLTRLDERLPVDPSRA